MAEEQNKKAHLLEVANDLLLLLESLHRVEHFELGGRTTRTTAHDTNGSARHACAVGVEDSV